MRLMMVLMMGIITVVRLLEHDFDNACLMWAAANIVLFLPKSTVLVINAGKKGDGDGAE